jgi:hypothetical protein
MKTAVMEKVSFLISKKKKKNNIGTDIEEAIIHSRCHFSQSRAVLVEATGKIKGVAEKTRLVIRGTVRRVKLLFFVKSKNNIKNKLD